MEMQIVPAPVFYPGIALGEASEQGRILDTLREYTHTGRVYLHEILIHEGARALGYSRPERTAEIQEALIETTQQLLAAQEELEKWRPLREAFELAAKEETARRRATRGKRKPEPEEVFDEVA